MPTKIDNNFLLEYQIMIFYDINSIRGIQIRGISGIKNEGGFYPPSIIKLYRSISTKEK
jgi:hypothetical protein